MPFLTCQNVCCEKRPIYTQMAAKPFTCFPFRLPWVSRFKRGCVVHLSQPHTLPTEWQTNVLMIFLRCLSYHEKNSASHFVKKYCMFTLWKGTRGTCTINKLWSWARAVKTCHIITVAFGIALWHSNIVLINSLLAYCDGFH